MPASLLHQSATVPSSDARAAAQRPGDATWSSHHNWQLNETLAPSGPLGEIYIVPPHTHTYTHTHTHTHRNLTQEVKTSLLIISLQTAGSRKNLQKDQRG